jgi:hypothetical protein
MRSKPELRAAAFASPKPGDRMLTSEIRVQHQVLQRAIPALNEKGAELSTIPG